MPAEHMTDEEYGRAWAGMMGKAPKVCDDGTLSWECDLPPGSKRRHEHRRPCALHYYWPDTGMYYMPDLAYAYATLGRAVRAVHAAVPPLAPETPHAR